MGFIIVNFNHSNISERLGKEGKYQILRLPPDPYTGSSVLSNLHLDLNQEQYVKTVLPVTQRFSGVVPSDLEGNYKRGSKRYNWEVQDTRPKCQKDPTCKFV